MFLKALVIGAPLALMTSSSLWFGGGAHSAQAGMKFSERVHLCQEQRINGEYFHRDTPRWRKKELQLQFRLCIREAIHVHLFGNGSSSTSSSSVSSSVSSPSSSSSSSSSPSSSSSSASVSSSASSSSSMSSSISSSLSSNSSSTTSSSSSSSQAQVVNITIDDDAFTPSSITIKKGTTVRWTNEDNKWHTVTRDGINGPWSGILHPNETYIFTFNTVGTYPYHCAIHSFMHGMVTVTE